VLRELEAPAPLAPRDILVHVPAGAFESSRRYPVLYMHDGQNLFDAATSFAGEWEVDETLQRLATEGLELIVVGIPNGGDARVNEYMPFPWRGGSREGGGLAATYVRFLVEHVKPAVDAAFPTLPDRTATGILGSSFGGTVSLWAAVENGQTFGLVGAMSSSVPPGQEPLLERLRSVTPRPDRIYLDVGGAEGDRGFRENVVRVRDAFVAAGLHDGEELRYVHEDGAIHHESAWARRLPDALRHLFGTFRSDLSSSDSHRPEYRL
jgi:predicted alpha/beta superfamily hydrolase